MVRIRVRVSRGRGRVSFIRVRGYRSLMENPGFINSALPYTFTPGTLVLTKEVRSISGVLPIMSM